MATPPPPLRVRKDARFTAYTQRWVILTVFGLSSFVNAFVWIMYSPIEADAARFFGTTDTGINFFSLAFMMTYLPGTVLSNWQRERYGLRYSLLWGNGLSSVGCLIRMAATAIPPSAGPARYAVTLLGQLVAGLGQPYFTNMPAAIAGSWFPTREREMATIIASLVNPLGNAAGSAVPGFVVTGPQDITALTLGIGGVALGVWALTWATVTDKPPTPPSAAASARSLLRSASLTPAAGGADSAALLSPSSEGGLVATPAADLLAGTDDEAHLAHIDPTTRMWLEARELLGNSNFRVLLVGFGIGLGMFNAFLTLIAQMVAPCGYHAAVAGICGGVLIGAGLVGAVVAGPLMEQTKAYVAVLKAGIVLAVGGVLFMLSSLVPGQEGRLIGAFATMGFFLLPMLPVTLENAAEVSYPIPEESASALLLSAGQLTGVIFTFTIQHTIPRTCGSVLKPSSIFIAVCLLLAAGVIMFYKEDNKRQRAEAAVHDSLAAGEAGDAPKGGDAAPRGVGIQLAP